MKPSLLEDPSTMRLMLMHSLMTHIPFEDPSRKLHNGMKGVYKGINYHENVTFLGYKYSKRFVHGTVTAEFENESGKRYIEPVEWFETEEADR